MKKLIKKTVSLLLCVVMVISFSSLAFAKEDVTPVIVVSGMGAYPLVNEDGSNAFPIESGTLAQNILKLMPYALGSIISDDWSLFKNNGIKPIYNLFEPISCDKNGNSVYNVTNYSFDGPASMHKDVLMKKGSNESHVVCKIAENIGWDNTYYMYYDWRMNPLDIADKLKATVDEVLAATESEKVSLYAISFGGMITSSYIYKYGTENIKNIVFSSTAFQGVEMIGKLFTNKIDLNLEKAIDYLATFAVENDFVAGLLGLSADALRTYGKNAAAVVNNYLTHIEDEISLELYKQVFAETFAHFKGIWCMVPSEYYEEAKSFMKNTSELSDEFLSSVDEYIYSVQSQLSSLLNSAMAYGTNVYITGAYGCSEIPVTEGKANQTDDLVDAYLMTAGGTFAPYGETLKATHYKKEAVCTFHDHKSTDGIADASTCILPEQTWIVKNMKHVEVLEKYETMDLAMWLLFSNEQLTVHSSESYPQFVELDRETGRFISLTKGVTLSEKTTVDFSSLFKELTEFLQKLLNNFIK